MKTSTPISSFLRHPVQSRSRLLGMAAALGTASAFLLTSAPLFAQSTWSGGGADGNWSTTGNFTPAIANSFSTGLVFAGSTRLTNNNDLTGGTATSLSFSSGAGAFVLGGNSFTIGTAVAGTSLTNSSSNTQTINNAIALGNAQNTWALTSGGVTLGGAASVAGTAAGITLTGGNVLTANTSGTLAGTVATLLMANTAGQKLVIGSGVAVTAPISGGGSTGGFLQFTDSTSSLIFNPGGGTNKTYSGTITGAGSLVVSITAGTHTINGNTASFTGNMEFQKGELRLNPSSSTYTIKLNGATAVNSTGLYTNAVGATHANNFNVVGNGGYFRNNAGTETLSGAVTGNGQFNLRQNVTSAVTPSVFNLTGDWTATNSFGAAFTGLLQFTSAGGTQNSNGTVNFNSAKSSTATAAYDIALIGTTLQTGNSVTTADLGSLTGIAGTTLRGNVVGTSTFSIGALGTTTTFAGAITDGSTPGTMFTAITKTGSGTLTLTGSNTYTGGTNINAGTLNTGASGTNLGAGSVTLGGGTLTLNASGIGNLSGLVNFTQTTGTTSFDIASLGSFDSIAGTGAFAINGGTIQLSGTLVGDGTDSYAIFTGFSGNTVGSFSFDTTGLSNLAGRTATLSNLGVLTFTAIPEPHQYALLVSGVLFLTILMRRRRHRISGC